jgi:4-carboxymuconolactone decarboxylase
MSTAPLEPVRFTPIATEDLTPEQQAVMKLYRSGWQAQLTDLPKHHWMTLRSPKFAAVVTPVSNYFRNESSLPARLNEFAILITARQWTSQYEWFAHHRLALQAGLSPEVAQAVAEGKRPMGMKADEEIVYNFCHELHTNKQVSDATYKAMVDQFGEQGVMDLIAVNGYYVLVSMVLNVDRTPIPGGGELPLKPLK